MNRIIHIDEVDNLTLKKINSLTDTPEKTIKFLQDLKLLPLHPTTVEACGNKINHSWYTAEYNRSSDGKSNYFSSVLFQYPSLSIVAILFFFSLWSRFSSNQFFFLFC